MNLQRCIRGIMSGSLRYPDEILLKAVVSLEQFFCELQEIWSGFELTDANESSFCWLHAHVNKSIVLRGFTHDAVRELLREVRDAGGMDLPAVN
jgi:hypothetical protein